MGSLVRLIARAGLFLLCLPMLLFFLGLGVIFRPKRTEVAEGAVVECFEEDFGANYHPAWLKKPLAQLSPEKRGIAFRRAYALQMFRPTSPKLSVWNPRWERANGSA